MKRRPDSHADPAFDKPRKRPNLVPQAEYLRIIEEVGGQATVTDLAKHLNVNRQVAKFKLDGLVAQGKLKRAHQPRGTGGPLYYHPDLEKKEPQCPTRA